jgi:lantibiotic modifying enzyme
MLENICIRILILDISEKKSNHELYGFTVHEEYNFYIKHFWKNESYKCDLAIRYAEGSRLQKLKEKYFVILQNEINEKINIDKDMISKKFHENMNEFQMLNKDQGDIHKNGRSVSKIEFDNGSILYYKPHSLDKDIKYQQLYKYLCEKAGISCREVRCLSRQTYGT